MSKSTSNFCDIYITTNPNTFIASDLHLMGAHRPHDLLLSVLPPLHDVIGWSSLCPRKRARVFDPRPGRDGRHHLRTTQNSRQGSWRGRSYTVVQELHTETNTAEEMPNPVGTVHSQLPGHRGSVARHRKWKQGQQTVIVRRLIQTGQAPS